MSKKQFLLLGKIWLLLLLFCQPAAAKGNTIAHQREDLEKTSFFKAAHTFNEDMLQPQAMSLRVLSEHSTKHFSFGYTALPFADKNDPVLSGMVGSAVVFLQDENRCESVSRLLFPYHIFW